MSSLPRYALLAALPSAAFLAAQKAVQLISTYRPVARPTPPAERAELAAEVQRLQAEYDDLCAHDPAAKAHKREAASLALTDAKDALFRHDLSSWLAC